MWSRFAIAGLSAAVLLFSAEVLLRRAVNAARSVFQWVITQDDSVPALDPDRLQSFLKGSFSPTLGWEPVPSSVGEDRARGSTVSFSIDSSGARRAPLGAPPPTVATFGDSYAFCRQVSDEETWAAVIGREYGIGVTNFGVGNYGIDQALLRYLERRDHLDSAVATVVAVFVPETIGRIRSVWKHWMEFGNTFGFKPRFALGPGGLKLIPCPVTGPDDYATLEAIIRQIEPLDPFFRTRFRRLQFRGSYVASLLRAPVRHVTTLSSVLAGRGLDGSLSQFAFERAFTQVMRGNVREAHRLYLDIDATGLLTAVMERFRDEVEADGRRFIACVIPQLLDLSSPRRASRTYGEYFAWLSQRMEIADLTAALRVHCVKDLYVNDRYGGHLSEFGNIIVAREIARLLVR